MFFETTLNKTISVKNRDEILDFSPDCNHKNIEAKFVTWLDDAQNKNEIQPDHSYKLALLNYRVRILAGEHYKGELENKITKIFRGSVEGFKEVNKCSALICSTADIWKGKKYYETAMFLKENIDTIIAFRDCKELTDLLKTLNLLISRIDDDDEAKGWLQEVFVDGDDDRILKALTKDNLEKITTEVVDAFDNFFPKENVNDFDLMRSFIRLFLIAEKPKKLILELNRVRSKFTNYFHGLFDGLNLEGTFEDRKFFINVINDELLEQYFNSDHTDNDPNYEWVCRQFDEACTGRSNGLRKMTYRIWVLFYYHIKGCFNLDQIYSYSPSPLPRRS